MEYDELELDTLGEEKTALFVIISDTDATFNFVVWEDGRKYEITRVKDKRRAANTKAGGVGERYTCVVDGKEIFLFYEDNNMWFMERAGA